MLAVCRPQHGGLIFEKTIGTRRNSVGRVRDGWHTEDAAALQAGRVVSLDEGIYDGGDGLAVVPWEDVGGRSARAVRRGLEGGEGVGTRRRAERCERISAEIATVGEVRR